VDTYDIAKYPQTGIIHGDYDLVCMWDVIEHLSNFEKLERLLFNTEHVALTIPIKPDNVKLRNWKHFKPGEHLKYFSRETLHELFHSYKFVLINCGNPECPPREDILSALYRKNTNPGG